MIAENQEHPGETYLLFDDIFISCLRFQALDLLLLLLCLGFVCALLFRQPAPKNRVRKDDGSWLTAASDTSRNAQLPRCRPKITPGCDGHQAIHPHSLQRFPD